MPDRQKEKGGWIGGWLGGFIWVLILAVVFFVQGRWIHGSIGVAITAVAAATIIYFAPWRYPKTRYRTLMMPIYIVFFAAVTWGLWALGDPRQLGLNNGWAVLLLLPILMPLWIAGNRRWDDSDA